MDLKFTPERDKGSGVPKTWEGLMKHNRVSVKLVKISLFLYVIDPLIYKSCSCRPKMGSWKKSLLLWKKICLIQNRPCTPKWHLNGISERSLWSHSQWLIREHFNFLLFLSFIYSSAFFSSVIFTWHALFISAAVFTMALFKAGRTWKGAERFGVKEPRGGIERN